MPYSIYYPVATYLTNQNHDITPADNCHPSPPCAHAKYKINENSGVRILIFKFAEKYFRKHKRYFAENGNRERGGNQLGGSEEHQDYGGRRGARDQRPRLEMGQTGT